ncbi:unnamed protein product [Didymodactylos carnosus]|uniref:Uncharacterized protein n=1 Tax=Didymodactylos carnosus TaxID=1234261 RepID=A0A8S2G5N9_9BILA|nr:unnamed protein product [Didymodactylos carnosus]CAF4455256.1 unnamed protein product [Didymodactylos carnosus]
MFPWCSCDGMISKYKKIILRAARNDVAAVTSDHMGNAIDNTINTKPLILSSHYGWSTHNCSCNRSVVLYPRDINHKNIVLLLCEQCYKYERNRHPQKTQHQQLIDWYYDIYADSKQFALVSGFSQDLKGHLKFNSTTLNTGHKYGSPTREMEPFEQEVVRKVVSDKLIKYTL